MNSVLQNLRLALRQLLHSPAFTLTAVLTLALGIGANTAIFSLLDQALFRTLPVQDPSQLVTLQDNTTHNTWEGSISTSGGDEKDVFTYPTYLQLRNQSTVFSSLAGVYTVNGISLTRNGTSRMVQTELVTGNYFTTLGVAPASGRVFTAADDGAPLANPETVVSYDFWRDDLGADPSVVGSTIQINSFPFQIIGVAAQGFHSAIWQQTPAFFFPMSMLPEIMPNDIRSSKTPRLQNDQARWMSIIGRLKPGITPAMAQAQLAPLWHALRADDLRKLGTRSPAFVRGFLTDARLQVSPAARGFSFNRDNLQKPLLAVMGMVLLVLVIAAVNVASLLLVRASTRAREFALRSALGASGSQILGQLLTEGLLIGVLGGAVGLLLAPIVLRALVAFLTVPDTESGFSASLDARVLLFNFGIAVLVSLLFSFTPALQIRRLDLSSTLREGRATGTGSALTLRRAVVLAQVGLSVLLLMASGIFLQTLHNLRKVDVGFNTTHLITFDIDPALAGYKTEQAPALHERIHRALSEMPGAISVGSTDTPQLTGSKGVSSFTLVGRPVIPDDPDRANVEAVSPSFFQTLQIPLTAGRLFDENDVVDHPRVVVVNEAFAKTFCGGVQACLGRMMTSNTPGKQGPQIVGVVRDSHNVNVRGVVDPTMYFALKQQPTETDAQFYVRTVGDPGQSLELVRRTMRNVDSRLSLGSLMTEDAQIDQNLQNARLIAILSLSFGVLATLLAGVGLYGVLAYSTAQRIREIGIRMALGSTRFAASMLIVSDVMKLAAIAVVVAIPVGLVLTRLVRAQLYDVSSFDPTLLVSVVFLIAAVALFAALVPARRAASVNPTEALRTE